MQVRIRQTGQGISVTISKRYSNGGYGKMTDRYQIHIRRDYIGTLIAEDDIPVRIDLLDGLEAGVVPALLHYQYQEGQRVFDDPEQIMEWVESRCFDRGRMNLDEILQDMGLKEYDPWEMFKRQKGRMANDRLRIQKEEKRHWVYSDPHYNHKRIIEMSDRPFTDLQHMETEMIKRYNDIVDKDDIVYWLGDVSFAGKEVTRGIISKMHGYKILILGNHDWPKPREWWIDAGFDEVTKYPMIVRKQFILSHQPMPMSDLTYFNIHGHVHHETMDSMFHFNACVEVHDYKPVLLNEIEQMFYKRKKKFKG